MPRPTADHDLLISINEQNKTLFKGLEKIEKQIEVHLTWSTKLAETMIPQFNRLQEQVIHVCEDLPDKGFCGDMKQMHDELYRSENSHSSLVKKVSRINQDLYPDNEASIPQRVEEMWMGYKLIKWAVGLAAAALITNVVVLFFH